MKLSSTLILLVIAQTGVAQQFVQTCRNMFLQHQNQLSAECMKDTVYWGSNQLLDLNHCVANNNGFLAAVSDGNYLQSCNGCVLNLDKLVFGLDCQCLVPGDEADFPGQRYGTNIDLNNIVGNDHGRLHCWEHYSTPT